MVIHQGYCRPLKRKVDFPVESVEALSTKKGEKWIVRGNYQGHKITTFVSRERGKELQSSMTNQEVEEVEVFGAEIAHVPAEEIEIFDAEEIVLEAPKIEHDMLEAKHYRKDGTLDMRYKICREVARGMGAESIAQEAEDDDDEMSSVELKTQRDLQDLAKEMGDDDDDDEMSSVELKTQRDLQELAKEMDAESIAQEAENDEQEEDEIDDIVTDVAIDSMFDAESMTCPPATQDVAINTKNRNLTIEKFGYGPLNVDEPGDFWEEIAEQWNTTVKAAKKSKCGNCVAFDESPRMKDCMPGETSDGEGTLGYCWMHHFKCHSARTCDTWAKGGPITTDKISEEWQEKAFGKSKASDMATSSTKTQVAAAETQKQQFSADPDLIIFEEHIPPEVWNKMSSSEKGKYISTRDETLLIAPCCGVSKAELRKDVDANYECTSCCFSGDDFHPRWWASEPAPSVRTIMDAEDIMDDSLNPNTAVVPNQVYYSMMMNLPDGVSVTQTEDGTSMILGFHNQNAARIEGLIEIYSPKEDDGDEGDTLISQEPVSFVPTVHFPEAKMNEFNADAFSEAMNAESFDVEFEEWGKQEMKTHGKDISFNDWLMEEAKSHGDMPLVEWAKDEEKSHDERYGAEAFESEWVVEAVQQNLNDKNFVNYAYKVLIGGDAKTFEEKSMAIAETMNQNANNEDFTSFVESELFNDERYEAESFDAESDRPLNKTVIGLLGIGALGAIFAPKQIKAFFDKLK